ncbi:hypothetical protein GX645_00255 [Candidatus Sumerlaeota bacterium]|nr:hypothetical protein [Candidatus Sumerlaeales bacterium]NLD60874.1 hypothetical protein [Candidatus Sumerlaeota bacterium]
MKKVIAIASILCLSAMVPIIVNAVCEPTPVNPDDGCYNYTVYSECQNDGTMIWSLYPGTQPYTVYVYVYDKKLEKYVCKPDHETYLYCGSGNPPFVTTGRELCDDRAGQTYCE